MGLTQTNQIPLLAIEYIWAAQAIVVFSLGAYYLDVNRFYLYGVLYAAPVPVGFTLLVSTDLPGLLLLPFIISSGIMLLLGTILFARFLTHYPLPPEGLPLEEALNGSRQ